jgi:integrase
MKEYRRKRLAERRSDATCNRELSILRTAMNLGRKCTPPKVFVLPFFPMVQETFVRQGFLSDKQYAALRDALPEYLKALFVTAYFTGIRVGELLVLKVSQVDLEAQHIVLQADETKSGHARAVPIVGGDMHTYLAANVALASEHGEDSPVFLYRGKPFKDFRESWRIACEKAGVPDLKFHDLRRTAVRNMRKAGIPQVVRMKISGHRTDSMERRYNIVDTDDLDNARLLLEKRRESKD